MYAIIKDGKVSELVKEHVEGSIKCDKPIYINGRRYAGRLPKVGYEWNGTSFNG